MFDGVRVHPRADVLVRDGVIAGIGPALAFGGATVIDGVGKTRTT